MKVLVLSHVSDYTGGAERSILDVLDIWAKEYGIKPEFILRKPLGTYTEQLDKRGWKYHALDYTYWSDSNLPTEQDKERLFTSSLRNSRAILEIEKIIDNTTPDLVLTNSIVAPWAAVAAYYKRIPHVWFAREYGGSDQGRKFEIDEASTFEDIVNLSELVVANSQALASHIRKYSDSDRITFLYNPFDIDVIKKLANKPSDNPYKRKDSLKTVLVSGGITSHKGQRELVEAAGILKGKGHDIEVCLIGRKTDSRFANELDVIINKLGLQDSVHFAGYQENPMAIVSKADVGVTASKEAFGRVTFEYLALGKPVVGANTGATPEMVIENETGFLFDKSNVNELAEKLEKYITSRDLITTHGANASNKAKEMMDGEHNVHNIFSKVKSVVALKTKVSAAPINYTHRWLEYPEIAVNYMNAQKDMSLRRLMYVRLRQKGRPLYQRLRRIQTKVFGDGR